MAVTINGSGQIIVQLITATTATPLTTTSTSYVDLGLSATITPTSASNRILVFVVVQSNTEGNANGHGTQIVRDATNIFTSGNTTDTFRNAVSTRFRAVYYYLDSPSTTSATTYKIQVANQNGNTMVYQNGDNQSQLILMEISG